MGGAAATRIALAVLTNENILPFARRRYRIGCCKCPEQSLKRLSSPERCSCREAHDTPYSPLDWCQILEKRKAQYGRSPASQRIKLPSKVPISLTVIRTGCERWNDLAALQFVQPPTTFHFFLRSANTFILFNLFTVTSLTILKVSQMLTSKKFLYCIYFL